MDDRYDPNLILAYVEDELDAKQRAEFERVFEQDSDLRDLVEQLAQDRVALRALPVDPPATSPAHAATAMLERDLLLGEASADPFGSAAGVASPQKQHHLFRTLAYVGVAAALALTGAVVVTNLTGTPLLDRARQLADAEPTSDGWDAGLESDFSDSDPTGGVRDAELGNEALASRLEAGTEEKLDELAAVTRAAEAGKPSASPASGDPDDAAILLSEALQDAIVMDDQATESSLGRDTLDAEAFGANTTMSVGSNFDLDLDDAEAVAGARVTATRPTSWHDTSGFASAELRMAGQSLYTVPDQRSRSSVVRNSAREVPADYTVTLALATAEPARSERELALWVVSNGGAVLNTQQFDAPVAATPATDGERLEVLADVREVRRFDRAQRGLVTAESAPRSQIEVLVPSDRYLAFIEQLPSAAPPPAPEGYAESVFGDAIDEALRGRGHSEPAAKREFGQGLTKLVTRGELAEVADPSSVEEKLRRDESQAGDLTGMEMEMGMGMGVKDSEGVPTELEPEQENRLYRAPLGLEDKHEDLPEGQRAVSPAQEAVAQRRAVLAQQPATVAADAAPLDAYYVNDLPALTPLADGGSLSYFYKWTPGLPAPAVSPAWSAGYWMTNTTPPPAPRQVRVIVDLVPAPSDDQ